MILFTCTNCGQAIYFENTRCEACGHIIGFVQEEHYRPGSIAESLKMELPNTDHFEALCAVYRPGQRYGSAAFHVKQSGMPPEALVAAVKKAASR